MVSTFHGLNTAYRGLMTQQSALHVTGHNIANANTPGYTRQRVNFEQTEPYPPASMNRPQIPGQMGTGVQAGDIQRIRDSFLDIQYRGQNSKLGYWEARANSFSQIEDIMNELNSQGLSNTIDKFWNSLQDLSTQPDDEGTRRVVRQQGIAVADTFNYLSKQLQLVQKDYKKEIDVSVNKVNTLIKQINNVNQQIKSIEPHGYLPNDLYDERDRLVDELSTYMNIEVETKSSGGISKDIADGYYNIFLLDETGKRIKSDPTNSSSPDIKILDGLTDGYVQLKMDYDDGTGLIEKIEFTNMKKDGTVSTTTTDSTGAVVNFSADGTETIKNTFDDFKMPGSLKALFEAYGYIQNPDATPSAEKVIVGTLPKMLEELDHMAFSFAERFNAINNLGWSLSDINSGTNALSGNDFFEFRDTTPPITFANRYNYKGAAANIKIGSKIEEDLKNIAASGAPKITTIEETKSGASFKLEYDHDNDPATANVPRKYLIGSEAIYSGSVELKNGIDYEINISSTGETTIDIINSSLGTGPFKVKYETYEPITDASKIGEGEGSNALALGRVINDSNLHFGGSRTNLKSFYQGVIGEMGVNASEANRMTINTAVLKDSVENRRNSVSNVSLDEEMTNMIQFQHAYNASARMITLVDEMLDRIINNMGLVGR